VTFLDINGFDFDASEADVVVAILRLAAGRISEDELTQWVRTHVRRRSK
jgi:prophage maintenance system killer protein